MSGKYKAMDIENEFIYFKIRSLVICNQHFEISKLSKSSIFFYLSIALKPRIRVSEKFNFLAFSRVTVRNLTILRHIYHALSCSHNLFVYYDDKV